MRHGRLARVRGLYNHVHVGMGRARPLRVQPARMCGPFFIQARKQKRTQDGGAFVNAEESAPRHVIRCELECFAGRDESTKAHADALGTAACGESATRGLDESFVR